MGANDDKRLGGARAPTKALAGLLVLVLLSGLGYLIWWGCQPPVKQTVRLNDGTRLSLAAVTHGTVHQFDPAPPLFRLARSLKLPMKAPEIATVTTPKPRTRVWFHIRPGDSAGENSDTFAVFEDAHGCPYDAGEQHDQSGGDGRDMWASIGPSPPLTDGRGFSIAGYDRGARVELLRFRVEAPAPPPPPQVRQALAPRPLPQTVFQSDMRATLVALDAISAPDEPHYRATIHGVHSQGARMSPLSLAVEDQYGHRMESLDNDKRAELPGAGFPFMGLCRREPAWKLIATLAAEPQAGIRPDVQWDLSSFPIWGGHRSLRRGKRTLMLTPGNSTLVEAKRKSKVKLVDFAVNASPRKAPCRLAVTRINGRNAQRAVAEMGSRFTPDIRPNLECVLTPESQWNDTLRVPVPEGARFLSLRIEEFTGKQVEFVVEPPNPR